MFILTVAHHALQRFPGPSQRRILIDVLRDFSKRGFSFFFSFWEVSDELGPRVWWFGGLGAF